MHKLTTSKKRTLSFAIPALSAIAALGALATFYSPDTAAVESTSGPHINRPGANFPDYGFAPPPSYTGPTFRLSQDYPLQAPAGTLPDFFKLLPATRSNDYDSWRAYMDAVKAYCLEGNAQTNWRVENNTTRKWYHMPWQHYGAAGREGINGLTKEAAIGAGQLAPSQTATGQTYAVGIYNDIGAYTIGQVWKDPYNPDPSHTAAPNGFANGTVVCKALFADIPLEQVPFLKNPVQWQGYITKTFSVAERQIKPLYLIQMDIAVRDERIQETGWLFGTFQYNGSQATSASWDNLEPVGIMWGNDPEVTASDFDNPTPTQTRINPDIKQSAINTNTTQLPPTHLGWNGRLNGPVDNPVSSCLSCHMTAQSPSLAPMNPTFVAKGVPVPDKGSPEWMKWFANLPAGQPFSQGAQSTDYSLQLAVGLANFYDWKCNESGVYASNPNACVQSARFRLQSHQRTDPSHIYPIVRDPALSSLR